jgi:hypothetical protein
LNAKGTWSSKRTSSLIVITCGEGLIKIWMSQAYIGGGQDSAKGTATQFDYGIIHLLDGGEGGGQGRWRRRGTYWKKSGLKIVSKL